MAGDRKLLSQDALALKAKVKAEMLRRSHSGSVAAYGGAAYDFTTPPANGGPVLGEHLKKNLEPMRAVNPDGLPTYPGGLTRQGQETMEARVNAWATRAIEDRTASDCQTGCTGTCFSACVTGCSTTCSGGCEDNCSSGCSGGCDDTCDGSCDSCDGCWDACEGCGSCDNSCDGCDGCTATCSDGDY